MTTPIKLSAKPGVPMKLRTAASYRLVIGGGGVEFRNILGEPLESAYVLERADGRLEEGRLEEGGVLRADAAPNEKFKVHFPSLDALEWGGEWVEVPDGEGKPEVELVLKHRALGPANEAVFSFFEALDDEELADDAAAEAPLHEIKAKLATDPARLVEPQETRVRWALDGLEALGPEEVRRVVCRAAVGGLEIESPVLDVYGPSPEESEAIEVEFLDALGEPLVSAYVLRHPDGRLEEGRLADGVLRLDAAAAKSALKVHFPSLVALEWGVEWIEVPDGGKKPEVELVLKHAALGPAHEAVFSFFEELDDEELADDAAAEAPLHEIKAKLATDPARLVEPQETRVRWALDGLEALGPEEVRRVVCRAAVAGLEIESPALEVYGPSPEESEKPLEVLRVEFRDAAGKPLESAYILEHPDGELEPGRLEKGILRRDVDAKGKFKVHFPKLIDASFAAEAVEFADGAAAPELEVILKHAAFASAAATATFSFFREFEGDDDADDAADEPDTAPLGEVRAALSANGADLLAPRETRVRWKLAGLAPPDPGTARRVVCRVQAGDLEIESASIDVFGAAPDDPD